MKRHCSWAVALVATLVALVCLTAPSPAYAADIEQMHRLYNRWTGEHFYTASAYERDELTKVGWRDEGVGWVAPTSGDPVYRLYNPYVTGGDHHYTTSADERDACVAAGWRYEGVGWYSADKDGVPLYRQYNPFATTGTHNYTASTVERNHLISVGWEDEGIAWYGVEAQDGSPESPEDDKAPRYSYEVYYLDNQGDTWYTNSSRTLFVKTDNPTAQGLRLVDSSGQNDVFTTYTLNMNSYDDVEPLAMDGNCLKVPGGFLMECAYEGNQRGDTEFTIMEPGNPDAQHRSARKSVAGVTFHVNVVDSADATNQWIDGLISRYTTTDMTPPEKMRAICTGIMQTFTYRTYLIEEQRYAFLVVDPDHPFWLTSRWDSFQSPAMLCQIAKRIGGFTNIHNCYGDYPYGTSEWYATHYLATMEYEGKEYAFHACPSKDTNPISLSDIEMVDFTDTSSMHRAS